MRCFCILTKNGVNNSREYRRDDSRKTAPPTARNTITSYSIFMRIALEEKNKAVENQPVTPVVCIHNYFHLLGKRRNYVAGVRPTGLRLLLQIECVPK